MLADSRKVLHAHRRPSARLSICRRCWPRGRAISSSPGGSGTAPAAPMTRRPPGMLLISAIDFETGNEEQAARRLAALVQRQPGNRRARRLLAAAQWRMNDPAAVVATLRPLADRPDADAYALSLIGRALTRTGDGEGAALYLARAARRSPPRSPRSIRWARASSPRVRRAAEAESRRRPGPGPADLGLARPRPDRRGAGARAPAAGGQIPGAPEVHILVGDALGAARRLRRGRRPISPRRQSRLQRRRGDAPDRGAAALRPGRRRRTTC